MINFVDAQESYNMDSVNQLTKQLITVKAHLIESGLAYEEREKSPKYLQLREKCKTDWSKIIDHFETMEGGEDAQKLVVNAFQVLEASDYMSALEKLTARFQAGKLSKSIILEFFSVQGKMHGFLADNYKHPRVKTMLNAIKAKVGDDAEMTSIINDFLSGEIKDGLDEMRKDFAGTAEGDIPKILLAE